MTILISVLFLWAGCLGLLGAGSMATWIGTVFFNPWRYYPTLLLSLISVFAGVIVSNL